MATKARQQYFADELSLQKQNREFSIADDIQQKIDSVEEGAQVNKIDIIKVNGSEVLPDENKAIDLTIPSVVDSLDSTSSTDALSAKQGKVLYDKITDVSHIGHFLALWDASTGLPATNPETSPYVYNTGDFYIVSNVAGLGGTNYRPDGTQFIIGQASTTVETENVAINDFYFYDGTTWRRMVNSGAGSIAIDDSLSTTSMNPVTNRRITQAINSKQDILTAGEGINIDSNNVISNTQPGPYVGSTAPQNPSEGDLWYDTTNDTLKAYDGTDWNATGTTYTAGANVQISPQNVISATDTKYVAGNNITIYGNTISAKDTTYTAGTGISISSSNVISNTQTDAEWGKIKGTLSDQADLQKALDKKQDKLIAGDNITIEDVCISTSDMQGPAPRGYHVPLTTEWVALCRVLTSTFRLDSSGITLETYLKMPRGGYRRTNSNLDYVGSYGYYWSSSAYSSTTQAYGVYFGQYSLYVQNQNYRTYGLPIRCFKDSPVTPDSSWTTLYDGSSVATGAGVFWNQSEGLISVSGDGTTWYTIKDKNLGATTVYNQGDTYTDDNCGLLYQWGNNYGFPRSGTITTTYIQADASGYGPGDYYSSDTFITGDRNWSSVNNNNLWGGVSQGTWQDCDLTISADVPDSAEWGNITGTLSDQTDLQEALDEKQDILIAGDNITITNNTISATATTYTAGTGIDITNDVISADTTTVATKADLASKQDVINDLSTIRSGAALGATSVQPGDNISDLTNDSGFITNSVNNLVNYYLKSETYTQAEVNNLIGSIQQFHYEIYPSISSITTPATNVLYLIGPSGTGADQYEEYVYSNNSFVKIGDTSIDLSGYVTTSALNTALANYTTTANLTALLAGKQDTLTAGDNITITNNTISATDTTYTAGEGIEIGDIDDYSAMQGPSLTCYHVPQSSEWVALCGILTSTFGLAGNATTMGTYLKMPRAGDREFSSSNVYYAGSYGFYWSSSAYSAPRAYGLYFYSSFLNPQNGYYRAAGFTVRCFKDSPVIPDSNWTTLYDGSEVADGAGVFWDETNGLISVSGDGETRYTIQDKNLGATSTDITSRDSYGYYYQWGNNYGFPNQGNVTTSSTQVDASGYGPGNYYSSDTFITENPDWSSVQNDNLWGGETGVVTLENAITNTGVLSVNGQTGDVTTHTSITVTLTSAGWTNNEQTVTASGVTASNSVVISPAPASIEDYAGGMVYCSAQASNSLAFACSSVPENDITVNVLILN